MLGRREYSRRELETKLKQKGCPAGIASQVIGELEAERLLSDRRFAEAVVRARRRRGFGPARIQHELKEKGVESELIGAALAQGAGDWVSELKQLRERKFGPALPDTAQARARQIRFLQSRGFTLEQIRQAMNSHDSD